MLQAVFGLVVFIALACAMSETRRLPDWKVITAGLGLQVVVALVLNVKTIPPPISRSDTVNHLQEGKMPKDSYHRNNQSLMKDYQEIN